MSVIGHEVASGHAVGVVGEDGLDPVGPGERSQDQHVGEDAGNHQHADDPALVVPGLEPQGAQERVRHARDHGHRHERRAQDELDQGVGEGDAPAAPATDGRHDHPGGNQTARDS